jgi:death-on-curing protein
LDEALAAHDLVLTRYGGLPGILDVGLVESAIARPYCGYYRSMPHKGAALIHSLALNHGFLDGNKRTAVYMLGVLLANSGYALRLERANKEIEEMILATAEHRIGFDDIVVWMKARLVRLR